jgi:hypothetical protein
LEVFVLALAAIVPTTGDFGLTWDEPAYRFSQLMSAQWWEQVARARSWPDLLALIDSDTLLYYWPYGRHGMNFHPPLAGQLNLFTYAALGEWLQDLPARRLASAIEYALAVALLFGFLSSRYGPWAGIVAAAALVLMPRVYVDGHVIGTDMPGMLLWGLTAFAFWKGLHDERGRRWRVWVGVLVGLCFVEKMAAVMVLVPLLAWLFFGYFLPALRRISWEWFDYLFTTSALLAPLVVAYIEIRRLAAVLPEPKYTNLLIHRPESDLPGAILAAPLGVWLLRRALAGVFRKGRLWGAERPALETWSAILAFAPLVAWLGNPAWWRETLPRLAHYYLLNTNREGSLPDIRIIYFGETYFFSLPWHNGWVLIGLTVPIGVLALGLIGVLYTLFVVRSDRLPFFLLVNAMTLPALRMLPTPAHDGVRLMLPAFYFLSALAGLGMAGFVGVGRRPGKLTALRVWFGTLITLAVIGEAAWALVAIHPFELSYYNALIGGPVGAWHQGMELSYWYDGFDPRAIREINDLPFPARSILGPPNKNENVPTFHELQTLGLLRGDLGLDEEREDAFPYEYLLTHDSKADPFSRLLFAMRPLYERTPEQLDGARVAAIYDPTAVSRSFALTLLASASGPRQPAVKAPLPDWLRSGVPLAARFWGDGLTLAMPRPGVNEEAFQWAREDAQELHDAALALERSEDTDATRRLRRLLTRKGDPSFERALDVLLRIRPEALPEAVEILNERAIDVRAVLLRQAYTDPRSIGVALESGLGPEGGPPKRKPRDDQAQPAATSNANDTMVDASQ